MSGLLEQTAEGNVAFLGTEFGQNTRKLLGGLFSLGPLFVAARFFTAVAQIVAGRLLGPREYGLATMAVAASALLTIPLNLGFAPAMVKFASMEDSADRQADVVSTALWANAAAFAPCLVVLYVFRRPLSAKLHVGMDVYAWSLAYSILLSAYTLVSSIPQAVARFGRRGWAEFVYGGASLVLFLALYFSGYRGFPGFVLSLMAALILAGVVAVHGSRDLIRFSFSRRTLARMSSYFWSPIIGACAVALILTATPLILASYLSPASAAILSIYELGTIGIAAVMAQVLGAVLLPMATTASRQRGAWRKFFFLGIPLFLGCFCVFMAADYAALRLVGRSYPINPAWMALFSLAAALYIPSNAAFNLLIARDARSLWIGTLGCVASGLASLGAILWAVPRYGFLGAGYAAVISYGVGLAWNVGCGLYMTYNGSEVEHAAVR